MARRLPMLGRHVYMAAIVAFGTLASVVLAVAVSTARAVQRRLRRY